MVTENEGNAIPGTSGGADSGGLAAIAQGAKPPEPGEVKRGRGRPAGSGKNPGQGVTPVPMAIQPPLWNTANVGSLVRLPFGTAAFITAMPELELTEAQQAFIIPSAVDVCNQFIPMAAAKYASLFAFTGAMISVTGGQWMLYKKIKAERAAQAKKESVK